ncbi:MAG: hypothetical protein HON98_12345 [Chloroflexi bacterium]|jgi:hypothetical protein|nr:hypothetical protein [Chloroflexota bacterium]MBT3669252.1 hypothetical protein [Chloroflexota bacterium]MBT4003077.1 hypothetical protein [Chloroflexota bacterium]MBT4305959.1 hypothetical protein [Chloroflexota bacterium]MBT4532603.1 hypothetical protein [Chloroflexota bacterium]
MKSRKNLKGLVFVFSTLILVSLACQSSGNNGNNQELDNNEVLTNNNSGDVDLDATAESLQKTQTALDNAVVNTPVPDSSEEIPENVYFTEFEDIEDWVVDMKEPNDPQYRFEYADPGLTMYAPLVNDWMAAYVDLWATDVRLEVDFAFLGGAEDSSLDVYCRANEEGEYSFTIYADGFWEIGFWDYTVDPGEFETLASGQSSLDSGDNFMVGYCEGNEISLFINGEFAGETTISNVAEGVVGVGLLTFDGGAGEWMVNYFAAEFLD